MQDDKEIKLQIQELNKKLDAGKKDHLLNLNQFVNQSKL